MPPLVRDAGKGGRTQHVFDCMQSSRILNGVHLQQSQKGYPCNPCGCVSAMFSIYGVWSQECIIRQTGLEAQVNVMCNKVKLTAQEVSLLVI